MGVSQNLGVPFWGPNNKDYSILGSILGSPYFGKLPNQENHEIMRLKRSRCCCSLLSPFSILSSVLDPLGLRESYQFYQGPRRGGRRPNQTKKQHYFVLDS